MFLFLLFFWSGAPSPTYPVSGCLCNSRGAFVGTKTRENQHRTVRTDLDAVPGEAARVSPAVYLFIKVAVDFVLDSRFSFSCSYVTRARSAALERGFILEPRQQKLRSERVQ